jgi:hypothetical protein
MNNAVLLQRFDLTPKGKLVVERPEILSKEYNENMEYEMILTFVDGGIIVYWYGEDGTEMSLEEYLSKVS